MKTTEMIIAINNAIENNGKVTRKQAVELAGAMLAEASKMGLSLEAEGKIQSIYDKLIEGFAKKSSSTNRKPTEQQLENEKLKETFLSDLKESGEKVRAGKYGESFGISQNRASALLNDLVKAGMLQKSKEKGATLFFA